MEISATASPADVQLVLENVSVSFPIYHGGARSLKKRLLYQGSGGRLARDVNQRVTVEALRNISLALRPGDRVALVGPNGAGKTTLLRVMAGIYEPEQGIVESRGLLSPMFDANVGIDSEINGYENIRLRGLILGLKPQEIEERIPEIVEFTDLGDYLDVPVRTYSSGMMARLTFAITTSFAPEILLMDEWIIAGDAGFMKKAHSRVDAFLERTSIVVLASHSEDICRRWCNKAVWLDHGEIKAYGGIGDVMDAYVRPAEAAVS
jgi:ABC-2 type transport system ATP-binding protein/lipopolysaccharide transport system ATP-binding protein